MILLNRKMDYALLLLCYLHHKQGGACAREIADHYRLSRPFVANILKELCRKGFVSSQRGVRGGYGAMDGLAARSLAHCSIRWRTRFGWPSVTRRCPRNAAT